MGDVGGSDGTQYATVHPIAGDGWGVFSISRSKHLTTNPALLRTVIIGQVGAKTAKPSTTSGLSRKYHQISIRLVVSKNVPARAHTDTLNKGDVAQKQRL